MDSTLLPAEVLEPDNAHDDECQAGEAGWAPVLVEEDHAEDCGAERANARPDGVGRADVAQPLHGLRQRDEAADHQHYRNHRRPELRKALGVLEADRPSDLEAAGDEQIDPRHVTKGKETAP